MALTGLSLTDFRNHPALTLRPDGRFMILHGSNGAGKTNILEAISLLVPGRGVRRATLGEMARTGGKGGFTISAELNDIHIGTGTEPNAPERRLVRINGASATANNLSEWLAIMWLTPAMDRLFADGAGNRRRFLDRLTLALEPGHARHSSRYEHGVRERNRILNDGHPPDPAWLDGIETEMAVSAAAINAGRNRLISGLCAILENGPQGVFARPKLMLNADHSENVDLLRDIWRAGRGRDRAAGRTLNGPHRADLIVHHQITGQAAHRCSTGEQKALLLSIIFAHADLVSQNRGTPPIMLLDEVAAHLDPKRRSALYEQLADSGCQVWMTGTEASLFDGIGTGGHFIAVDGGISI